MGCRGTPAKVQHHLQSVETLPRSTGQQSIAVMLQQLRTVMGRSTTRVHRIGDTFGFTPQPGFDRPLKLWPHLVAIGAEDLDAVVMRRVMAGGHHQATGGTAMTDQLRNRWCRAETQGPHFSTCSG